MSYPIDYKTETWSSCALYDTDFSEEYYSSKLPANRSKNCDQWIYDKSIFQNTAVMEVSMCYDIVIILKTTYLN